MYIASEKGIATAGLSCDPLMSTPLIAIQALNPNMTSARSDATRNSTATPSAWLACLLGSLGSSQPGAVDRGWMVCHTHLLAPMPTIAATIASGSPRYIKYAASANAANAASTATLVQTVLRGLAPVGTFTSALACWFDMLLRCQVPSS